MTHDVLLDAEPREPTAELAVVDFLNGVGNHELKLLLGAIVLSEPDRDFTESEANKELSARQGATLAWPIGPKVAGQYFQRSLEPIGAVVKQLGPGAYGKIVSHYTATPDFIDHKLALCGFLLDWSLRYSDFSLQHILGSSVSGNDTRAPETRHALLGTLLNSDVGMTVDELAKLSRGEEASSHDIEVHVAKLHKIGIVDKKSKRVAYDPTLEIVNPEFKHIALSLEDRNPETQAMFRAMKRLGRGAQLTVNQLVAAAVEEDGEIDNVKLRKKIAYSLSKDVRWFPGLRPVEEAAIPSSQITDVSMRPEARPMIEELVSGISQIINEQQLSHWTARARGIIINTDDFHALVKKARSASPYAEKAEGANIVAQRLHEIARALGTSTVETLVHTYEQTHQKRIQPGNVRAIMKQVVESGDFELVRTVVQENTRRQHNTYVYPPTSQTTD